MADCPALGGGLGREGGKRGGGTTPRSCSPSLLCYIDVSRRKSFIGKRQTVTRFFLSFRFPTLTFAYAFCWEFQEGQNNLLASVPPVETVSKEGGNGRCRVLRVSSRRRSRMGSSPGRSCSPRTSLVCTPFLVPFPIAVVKCQVSSLFPKTELGGRRRECCKGEGGRDERWNGSTETDTALPPPSPFASGYETDKRRK